MVKFNIFLISVMAIINIGFCEVIRLSCSDIKTLVNGHNKRRQLVARGKVSGQPAASNMKYMKWDEELAAKAEDWAANGVFDHNPDTSLASQRFSTGENLFYQSWTGPYKVNLDESIDNWFNEHKYYTFGPVPRFGETQEDVGHYTQMVWADTMYVGCGISLSQNHRSYSMLLICNYGPPGNYIGQEPYKRSNKASRLVGNKTQLYGQHCYI